MIGLKAVVKQVELQGNDSEWNLGSWEGTSQKEYSVDIFQRKVMLMNLLSTHMGDGKLALISFPNNHEDLVLEL